MARCLAVTALHLQPCIQQRGDDAPKLWEGEAGAHGARRTCMLASPSCLPRNMWLHAPNAVNHLPTCNEHDSCCMRARGLGGGADSSSGERERGLHAAAPPPLPQRHCQPGKSSWQRTMWH